MQSRLLSKKEKIPFIIMEEDDMFRSYGICNFTLTRPATNLNKIKIKSNLKKQLDKYPRKYKLEVYYEDTKLKEIKSIGEGAYGKVVLYAGEHKGKERAVVVKIPFDDSNPYEEPDILKAYMDKAAICHHYVVPIRSVDDQYGNPFIIMQQANGSIENLDLDPRLKIKLAIQITKIMECFFKNGFIYMDLKKENLLYRCQGEKITFFLGDIGGFAKVGENSKNSKDLSTSSFIPPEYAYADKKVRKADKQTLLYIVGATIADLYNLADDIFYADSEGNDYTGAELKKVQIPKFHKKIKASNIPEAVKEIILAFTSISPKKRLEYKLDMVFEKLCPNKK